MIFCRGLRILLSICTVLICTIITAGAQTAASVVIHKVLDQDFPDPTVIRVGRMYYAYATQGRVNGKHIRIQVASSTDHEHWKYRGEALSVPAWSVAASAFWAPDVFYDDRLKKFVMFFSADQNALPGKCIGVAYSKTPLGPFIPTRQPVLHDEGFRAIDPKGFTDPVTGRHFLYWGSDFQPLKVREMQADWSDFKRGSHPVAVVWPGQDKTYSQLIEGAWLDFDHDYYYLYYSGDNCCGDSAHYAVMVARAKHPSGPFTRLGESNNRLIGTILTNDSTFNAPGHNSVFTDTEGRKWIAYHAIDVKHPGKGRVMCINPLIYRNGWPVVKSAF